LANQDLAERLADLATKAQMQGKLSIFKWNFNWL
jgi:hypothetical protein